MTGERGSERVGDWPIKMRRITSLSSTFYALDDVRVWVVAYQVLSDGQQSYARII